MTPLTMTPEHSPAARPSAPRTRRPKTGLTVVMPALNEEDNIAAAVESCLAGFAEFGIEGEIVAIDDGSSDRTGSILAELARRDSRVRVLTHPAPRGIGASFWDGIEAAASPAVVMLPGDNENDPAEIFRYLGLLDHVDIVVPFVFNRAARSPWRVLLSRLFRLIVNASFGTHFNYTNGTCLYRRSILKDLGSREPGFFYQTDILVRLARRGYLFAEVPYRLGGRHAGRAKAVSWASLKQVVRGYARLLGDLRLAAPKEAFAAYPPDSATLSRREPDRRAETA